MSTPHRHISKGSMKLAHNLDDRQERAQLRTDDQPTPVIANKVSTVAKSAASKLDAIRAALRAKEGNNAQ